MLEALSHFFKPEIQNAARELVAKGAVYLKIGSDTQIDASIRGSTPVRVAFRSISIESEEFTADCTCKTAAKGQFCKHVWATLVVASEKTPDFFSEKTTITKIDSFAQKASTLAAKKPRSAESIQREIDTKQRQADHRKQAYQQQKARANERASKTSERASKQDLFLAPEVQTALQYFEQNGFPISLPVNTEQLSAAKRVLSRVFHPDKGGTQDEMLELLKHSDVLLKHR